MPTLRSVLIPVTVNCAMAEVMLLKNLPRSPLQALLAHYGLSLIELNEKTQISGSYWGEPEAGLVGTELLARPDTPVHSVLHEACHYICMDPARREHLHTNAGGTDTEENAVCYLQCLLADQLLGYSRAQCFRDMDAWGYHFILGSAAAWFAADAEDARRWLVQHGRLDANNQPIVQKIYSDNYLDLA